MRKKLSVDSLKNVQFYDYDDNKSGELIATAECDHYTYHCKLLLYTCQDEREAMQLGVKYKCIGIGTHGRSKIKRFENTNYDSDCSGTRESLMHHLDASNRWWYQHCCGRG